MQEKKSLRYYAADKDSQCMYIWVCHLRLILLGNQ